MKIRIALAGELPSDQRLFGQIDLLVGQISGYLCKENADADLQILVSPSYTGKTWLQWNETHGFSICTYHMRDHFDDAAQCAQTVRTDTPLRDLVGEAMCDKADAVIMVWNEDVTEFSGATWEFMRIAYDRKVPCIWISTKSQQIYCLWEAYYKKYSPQYLSAVCEPLPKEPPQPANIEEKVGRIQTFWENRRANYLRKYKADRSIYPSEEDYLLKQDFQMEKEASGGEAVRQILLNKFEQFDTAAIQLNTRFQSAIYQRSVLPFIATIFLAVGFYAGSFNSLIGKAISLVVPGFAAPETTSAAILEAVLACIAGIGFLIHAFLNLYVYRLSKSRRVYRWQKDFANDRYVAEILRVLIHFLPYGVELDLRKLCAGDRKMYTSVKHLTDDAEPAEQTLDRKTIRCILQHVKEMLEDQISYHEASANRYQAIVSTLGKWGKTGFYIGFFMVVGRGMLQFVLALPPINMPEIIGPFLNMLALMLPAWAGYFSTKAQQNNFVFNLNNHIRMISKLGALRERISRLLEQEEVSVEVFHVVAEELAETMLIEDASGWQYQYMNATVNPL